MRVRRGKFLFGVYVLLASSLSVGWQSESSSRNLSLVTGKLGNASEMICLRDENNRLFLQGVAETSDEQRRQNEQADEDCRRTVQTAEKKYVSKIKERKSRPCFAAKKAERRILERIVEAEAGDQNVKGRMLVANVVLNRVRSKEFPDSIRGVVFSPRQFSPVSNGRYYSVHVTKITRRAVKKALRGEDASKGALYFMCRSASSPGNVAWFDRDLTRLFSYGCHEFFR